MAVEMLAWCGAALSCLLCIPQAARTLRAERLDGVSASTYWILPANAGVWAAWSLLTGEHAAGGRRWSTVPPRPHPGPPCGRPSQPSAHAVGHCPCLNWGVGHHHATTGDRLAPRFRHPQLSQHPVTPTGTQGTWPAPGSVRSYSRALGLSRVRPGQNG